MVKKSIAIVEKQTNKKERKIETQGGWPLLRCKKNAKLMNWHGVNNQYLPPLNIPCLIDTIRKRWETRFSRMVVGLLIFEAVYQFEV